MKKLITIILIMILGFPILSFSKEEYINKQQKNVIKLITEIATKEGVNVNVCKSISRIESNFNPDAFNDNTFNFTKNNKNNNIKYGSQEKYVSRGVMQLTFATAKSFNKNIKNIKDLYDARKNIVAGARFIKYLFKKYPTATFAEISQIYNLGETSYNKGYRNTKYENEFLKYYMLYSNKK